MTLCEKCIHGDVCGDRDGYDEGDERALIFCSEFKSKDDVVEVVRCKDCAHYIEMKGFDYNGRKARSCVWHSALRGENDYCSDAIRTSKKGGEQG